jgi:hypothetical protein
MSRFTLDHNTLLTPPPHVQAEVDAAWERARDLFAGELELHFDLSGLAGRLSAELRVPGGETVERLTASEALALACGDIAIVQQREPALAA